MSVGRRMRRNAQRDRGGVCSSCRAGQLLEEIQGLEERAIEAVRFAKAKGARSTDVLRVVGLLVHAANYGAEALEFFREPRPEQLERLRDSCATGLLSIFSATQSERAETRELGAWALAELGLTRADVGLEQVPLPATHQEVVADCTATMEKLRGVVARLWVTPAQPVGAVLSAALAREPSAARPAPARA